MITKIELRAAFAWDCEACGRENFARAIQLELSPDEQQEFADALGRRCRPRFRLMAPRNVQCQFCRAKFPTAVS